MVAHTFMENFYIPGEHENEKKRENFQALNTTARLAL